MIVDAPRPKASARWRRNRRFLLQAVAQAVIVSVAVVVVTFLLVRLIPGDPARQILGPQAPQAAVDQLRHELHLDEPLSAQFGDFVAGLAHGDLGTSLANRRPVAGLVLDGLANTMALLVSTVLLSIAVAFPLGLLAGMSRRSLVDRAVRGGAMLALATPSALAGIVLILLLAVHAGIAPAGGWGDGFPENFRYLWLPALALSLLLAPILLRAVRQRARVVLREQHIEAALARGMSSRRLALHHVLPNAALPVITLLGVTFGQLVGGAVVIEAVFGIPGIGSTLVLAVAYSDYPVVQGVALVTGVIVVLGNLLAELLQSLVDPRVST